MCIRIPYTHYIIFYIYIHTVQHCPFDFCVCGCGIFTILASCCRCQSPWSSCKPTWESWWIYGDIVEVCCRRLLKYVEASRLYHASMVFSITVELCVAIGSLVHFFSERWNSMTVLLAEVWKGLQEVKLWPLANGKACFHDWTFKNTLDMHMANQYFWASCHSK